jgi:hypothetical protein
MCEPVKMLEKKRKIWSLRRKVVKVQNFVSKSKPNFEWISLYRDDTFIEIFKDFDISKFHYYHAFRN